VYYDTVSGTDLAGYPTLTGGTFDFEGSSSPHSRLSMVAFWRDLFMPSNNRIQPLSIAD
jgi:hypothetical protein